MKDELVFSHTPISEETKKKIITLSHTSEFKLILLDEILSILTKKSATIEESALLFHQAATPARLLKNAIEK